MSDEGVLECGRHQGGIAGLLDQVVEQPGELAGFAAGDEQALSDARGDGQQVGVAQLGHKTVVARENDAQDGARVEVGRGEQAHLGQHRVGELLCLVDEQERAQAGLAQVGAPVLAQPLEADPAVVVGQGDAEEVGEFVVEVGDAGRGTGQHRDPQPLGVLETVGEQAKRHALAGAGVAGDHREAAVAHELALDPAAEAVEGRGGHEAFDRQVGGEGIELQPVEGEQFAVHEVSPRSSSLPGWGVS